MKKIGLFILGGIAAIILLANIGPIAIFAISLVILYYVFKGFMNADTSFSKIAWAILGLILLSSVASNVPALVGLIAAVVLYFVFKSWDEVDRSSEAPLTNEKQETDPFVNFEKEWAELKRNY